MKTDGLPNDETPAALAGFANVLEIVENYHADPGPLAAVFRGFDRVEARGDRAELPAAFVLDAGAVRDHGPAVVEANSASGAGIYGCGPIDVLDVLRAATVQGGSGDFPT